MDFLRDFIGNKPNETIVYPTAHEWLLHVPLGYDICLYIACICSVLVVALGVLHLYFVLRFISNEQIQSDLYWIVFMCPVVSLCGTFGMILSRSALFLYAIALVYFMICIFVMVTLMSTLHGSRSAMCEKLMRGNVKISVQVMPLGCCLCCFPKLDPTEYNFRRIEWLVFQSPLVRIFLEILNIIVFFELNTRNNMFFQITNLIGMLSLFIGSYGSYIIIPPGSKLLNAYRFSLMFRIVDFSQLAYSVQKFVFDFLAVVGVFPNGPFLPDSGKAQFFTSFILALEMLLVSVSGTILFRPSQTVFFDLYPGAGSEARGRQPVKNMSNVSSLCNTMGKNNTGGTRQNSGYLADSVDVMDPRRVGDENDDADDMDTAGGLSFSGEHAAARCQRNAAKRRRAAELCESEVLPSPCDASSAVEVLTPSASDYLNGQKPVYTPATIIKICDNDDVVAKSRSNKRTDDSSTSLRVCST